MIKALQMRRESVATAAMILMLLLAAGYAYAEESMTDREVTEAVTTELVLDPAVYADMIEVRTNTGIVTIEGSVTSILEKRRAETLAGTVRGVRGIINRITVDAPEIADDTLGMNVRRAIIWDPALEDLEISVTAEDGTVTLEGSVQSYQERRLAEKAAAGVRGVTDINNGITVSPVADRPDSEIVREIERSMYWNAWLDEYLIDVSIDDGNVTLSGTVGSLAEKNEATRLAWVTGVETVDNFDLEVDPDYRTDHRREERYTELPDSEIEDAVFASYLYDPRVNALLIDIKAEDGMVTLEGTVQDLRTRRTAALNARNVTGVREVENLIRVRPEIRPDREIRDDLAYALAQDPYVEKFQIDITVEDGLVYLDGSVDTHYEKARADDIASRQPGVTEVVNRLTADAPDVIVQQPYARDWYLYDFSWYDPSTVNAEPDLTDTQIEQRIEERLFWSPFIDGGDISVEVNGGVATLTGTVDTWSQREEVVQNALRGGASAVKDRLIVAYGAGY
ncbi:MAG: BON domain-containing protein [Candidatus Aegiribacteria sp.]